MHEGQHRVELHQVRALVDDQFPAWRSWALTPVASDGTVNALVRIGDDLVARLPLQGEDPVVVGEVLAREANASAELARSVTLPTPRPVALGRPGHGYPLPWSVQTWVPGQVLTGAGLQDSAQLAADLAVLVHELSSTPTRGRRFSGSGRGGNLTRHEEWVQTCLTRSEGLVDVATLRIGWSRLRSLPREDPDAMTHGDLMPGNLLASDGRLAGVLDTGGYGPADPALDLVAAWHLLEAGPRHVLRAALGSSDLAWARGQAWALEQSLGLVWYYQQSNPVMADIGARTLARIIDDPAW